MKISTLCSDLHHPIFPHLQRWGEERAADHRIELVTRGSELTGGDILFLISCHEVIPKSVRKKYQKTLVIHASDLPHGRGWSPHVWAILENQSHIVVSLLEADDPPDTGAIWAKTSFDLDGHELHDEINAKLFRAELELMDLALGSFADLSPTPQPETGATYYRRRLPEDSRIDPSRSIDDQFALLRVCDPARYPAYFERNGHLYEVILRKRSLN